MSKIKNGNWSPDRIRKKLAQLHEQENDFNREMNKLHYVITHTQNLKASLQRRVSANHKYRALLTSFLPPPEPTKK